MRWKKRRGCAVAWRIALRLGSLGAVCRTGVGGSWKPLLCGFQIAVLRWTVYLGVLSGWTATACWPPSMPAGGWLSERQVELVKSATGLGAGGALILAHGLLDLRPGQIPELIAQLIENLEHGQHLLGRPVERQHRCPTLYFLLALRAVLARAAAFCPACSLASFKPVGCRGRFKFEATRMGALPQAPMRPGVVEDPGMHARSLYGNWEISSLTLGASHGRRPASGR